MNQRTYTAAFIVLFTLGLLFTSASAHDDPPVPDGTPHVHDDITLAETPTYYRDVKPIIDQHCIGCHAPGQIGHASAPLDELDVVVDGAEDIAFYAQEGYMPPWMPGPDTIPLKNERGLNAEEIAILTAWAAAGAPLGDPAAAATLPTVDIPQVRADMVLQLDAPYTPDTSNTDDYRCFVFDPGLTEPTYVTGYLFEPGELEIVHHAILYQINSEVRERAFAKDAEDEQPGWSCYNTTHLGGRYETMVGTWAPGTTPVFYPAGSGYKIEPGDLFVMQIHYNTSAGVMPDHTRIALQFAEPGKFMLPLWTAQLQAPVEIPCPAGMTGEACERASAVRYAAQRYGSEFYQRPDTLLRMCDKTLARDYANLDASHAVSSCDTPVPFTVVATEVFGHMHELGKSLRIELNPDTPEAQVLLDVPEWDFHWQDRYQFAEPVTITRGDIVRMTCVWDNTLSENPRYIVWGEGTGDEMCFGTVTLVGMP